MEILPARLAYLALLLYSYRDEERYLLNPFAWHLCDAAPFEEVEGWLKADAFPSLLDSPAIIRGLGHGAIGTRNPEILDSVICPVGNRSLVINIDWPDDKRPGAGIHVRSRVRSPQRRRVRA
jgi:hypothetical protein